MPLVLWNFSQEPPAFLDDRHLSFFILGVAHNNPTEFTDLNFFWLDIAMVRYIAKDVLKQLPQNPWSSQGTDTNLRKCRWSENHATSEMVWNLRAVFKSSN